MSSRRLTEVEKQARRVRALEERLTSARADRDAAIRDAMGVKGRPLVSVAREAGLSRQAVYDILSASRLDMSSGATSIDTDNPNR